MARKIRIEYAGAIYHVMNRGDRREAIYKDDADRKRFLETVRGVPEDGLGGSRLLLDGQPLSSGGGDAQSEPGQWHEVVVGHLHLAV